MVEPKKWGLAKTIFHPSMPSFLLPTKLPKHFSVPSILTLLKSCKTQTHLYQVHSHIIKKGLQQDHFLISHLISLCNSLVYSKSIFDYLLSPSTFLWNILLKGYSQRSRFVEVFSLFIRMRREEGVPDKYTYPLVIKAFSCELKLQEGKSIHASVIRAGFDNDVFVGTSLIDLYGKSREIMCSRKVFDGMSDRNVVSWTAMVSGYLNIGNIVEAKHLFDLMPERNVATWNVLIGALVKLGDMKSARKLFDEMPERNVVSYTSMIDGYAKGGDMTSARSLFEEAPDRDIIAWSALISGYAQNGQPNEAIKIFLKMVSKNIQPDEFIMVSLMSACSQIGNLKLAKWVDHYVGKSDFDIGRSHVIAALIDMNAKCGNLDKAEKLFGKMPKRDLISYCSMIQGLSIHGYGSQAIELFDMMLSEGLTPDDVAFTVILTACSHAGLVEEAWRYFELMQNGYKIIPSPDHYACMVDLLSRTGHLEAAYELLNSMPMEPHAGAWGALLGACKLHGDIKLGELIAKKLFDIEPQNAGNYVLLSNIYAGAERWLDVSLVRNKMKEMGLRKIPGCSSI